jgi:tight adherence protein C
MGYRMLCALVFPGVWLWAGATAGMSGFVVVVGILVGALTGWLAPARVVQTRKQRRLAEVDEQLPELIDLLVVTIEAGLGFNGSLQIAADRLGGALGDELRLTLQEQRMGMSTNDSLRNMLERADSPAMRSFVRSILQGETLGVSIGQIMRNLAIEMRKRRKANAEEKAQKAPIKILFPLVFLIFPAMFVILLAPAVFSFLDAFAGR